MKIQCDMCEAAAAEVVCCTEEAALCGGCDSRTHAAGSKIATSHHRLPLSAATRPRCDTCQETLGFFFCVEDRAVLCRQCDASTHKAGPLKSNHRRLLITNVKVGLEAKESTSSIAEFSQRRGSQSILKTVEEVLNENLQSGKSLLRLWSADNVPHIPMFSDFCLVGKIAVAIVE